MGKLVNIIVNGFGEKAPAGSTVAQLVKLFGENHPDLICELNGRYIHRKDYASTVAPPGARLEFIHAAFGG
jgi:sulfur carrier protein